MEKNRELYDQFEDNTEVRLEKIEDKLTLTANLADVNKIDLKKQKDKFTDFYDYTQSVIRQFKEQFQDIDDKIIDSDNRLSKIFT